MIHWPRRHTEFRSHTILINSMREPQPQLPVGDPTRESVARASVRLIVSLLGGVVIGVAVGMSRSWKYAPLGGWDAAAIVYLIWVWISIYGRDAQATANLAVREDPGRAWADI